ncbi:long-chain-fatty-acid--CoA ligase [Chitinasiproducens palmae]|uniref:Long-chain-fatty-acid--CoA ligase n=1 Tax=Chitinasiproducens palmae TaxID=1770053 RepID=A0A1H2PRV8_9BURK|nr:long-chain-fatty-acid--CoA ligase [Chitinasiproducens palmae]SDV49604.1 long-chain acyl-CoA synthetase [Chitinasiproducens palmae]
MTKPWLREYPEGVATEVDTTRYGSLLDLFEESFARYADRPAFACMGHTLSYADVDRASARFAGWLRSTGLPTDARVALMMPNILQYPIALIGALRAGMIVVNVNPLYTARELKHQLLDSGAQAIVVLENFANTVAKVLDEVPLRHVVVTSLGEMLGAKGWLVDFAVRHVKKLVPEWHLPGAVRWTRALAIGARDEAVAPVTRQASDVALLQYTGGTTGVAKGAILLHSNLLANVLQSEMWLAPARRRKPDAGQMITIAALPLYHIYALTVCALLSVRAGGLSVLVPNPRDIPGLVKAMARYRFNSLPAVNTLFNALVNEPSFARLDFSGLYAANGGGMAVQESVARRWVEITGVPIVEGYGLSETSPCVTCNRGDADTYSGTIGLPLPSTDVSIRDDAGQALEAGQAGEICVKGPQVMAGYWQRPADTAAVMTDDGFFRTGDIGFIDARGYVKLVDRKKDMILVSGFNVYPNEIEEVVAAHPAVNEVAVVGVDDARSGEAVRLYVVRKDRSLTEAELAAFCRERLTGYKRPRDIVFRDTLPKTNVGKILRRALRDEGRAAGPDAGRDAGGATAEAGALSTGSH